MSDIYRLTDLYSELSSSMEARIEATIKFPPANSTGILVIKTENSVYDTLKVKCIETISDDQTFKEIDSYEDNGTMVSVWFDPDENISGVFLNAENQQDSRAYVTGLMEATAVTIEITWDGEEKKKMDNNFVNVSPETDINKMLYLLECSINGTEPETPAYYPDYKASMAKIAHGAEYEAVDPNQYPSIAESIEYILKHYTVTLTPANG